MKRYEEMLEIIKASESDFRKFYQKGNKSAGVRLRKHMQNIRRFAKMIRDEVQEMKGLRDETGKSEKKLRRSA